MGNGIKALKRGLFARIQHEIDHVNGILITDRLKPSDVQGSINEMMALRRSEFLKEKQKILDKLLEKKNTPH
ncbi:peptide deformylase [Facilibium subflavum]|uniref:peptide deformylase n=1 Tax=Facilibium subflavum TaxID=2219058 RepID=UPI001AACDEC3